MVLTQNGCKPQGLKAKWECMSLIKEAEAREDRKSVGKGEQREGLGHAACGWAGRCEMVHQRS